ncbi:a-factor receptor [Exserohilum turcicum]
MEVLAGGTAYPLGHGADAPTYFQAILFPALAFPAWILCLPSMIWHFRQANVAAGSNILWIILHNFFNSINALIWPRDNLLDWWNGSVWCDVHVRIQVASYVGIAASAAMITRKLARVMDTRNITVSSSRKSRIREKIWEVVWCWGAPFVLAIVYYVVQPARYIIYGIVGFLLVYRLYRYRQEFHRLVAAQNTTSSRFIRLFILSMTISVIYLTYSIYITVVVALVAKDPYSWSTVHDPVQFNTIIHVPVDGQVAYDKWIQVATGYITFVLFGTGVDAHNFYRKLLLSMGLGKLWPSLYRPSEAGNRTPSSFIAARSWTSSVSSKAKQFLWSSSATHSTKSLGNTSVALDDSGSALHSVTTEDALVAQKQAESEQAQHGPPARNSLFKRWFARPHTAIALLPLFRYRNIAEPHTANASTTNTTTTASTAAAADTVASTSAPGVHAHAWATQAGRASDADGVYVLHEVHQDRHARRDTEKDDNTESIYAWTHVKA